MAWVSLPCAPTEDVVHRLNRHAVLQRKVCRVATSGTLGANLFNQCFREFRSRSVVGGGWRTWKVALFKHAYVGTGYTIKERNVFCGVSGKKQFSDAIDVVKRQFAVSSVARLNKLISPSTVVRFIVFVHINAVQARAFWPCTHVKNKSIKTVSPAVAHRNPSTTIVRPVVVFGVVAAVDCPAPRVEEGVSLTVGKVAHGSIVNCVRFKIVENRCYKSSISDATRQHMQREASRCTLRSNKKGNATHREPIGAVLALHVAGVR